MQLLIDAAVVGARRMFDFEWLAPDPVFEHLAGGAVPSIDTLYDDLRRKVPAITTRAGTKGRPPRGFARSAGISGWI